MRIRTILIILTCVFVLGLIQAETGDSVNVEMVERELTAPTGDTIFWHLKGSGLVCSASSDSAGGKLLTAWEGKKVVLTVMPARELQKIER